MEVPLFPMFQSFAETLLWISGMSCCEVGYRASSVSKYLGVFISKVDQTINPGAAWHWWCRQQYAAKGYK